MYVAAADKEAALLLDREGRSVRSGLALCPGRRSEHDHGKYRHDPTQRLGHIAPHHESGARRPDVLCARYTSPMPPAPIGATISYGPRRVPATSLIASTSRPSSARP